MLLAGWGVWLGMLYFTPTKMIPAYPIIPFVFFVTGFIFIHIIVYNKRIKPLKLASLYLLLKVAKMFVFGAMVLAYVWKVDIDKKVFIVVFSAFYIIYTAFETFTFNLVEKKLKSNK